MLQIILNNPILLYSWVFGSCLLLGSFFNVVIYRLPLMIFKEYEKNAQEYLDEKSQLTASNVSESVSADSVAMESDLNLLALPKYTSIQGPSLNLVTPRSQCPNCHQPLRAWHNIPILSFLVLKGRCYYCKSKISVRYPFVELLTALLSVFVVYQFGISYYTLMALGFTWVLIIITFIDFDHQIIPDDLVMPFMWFALAFYSLSLPFTPMSLTDSLWGAIFGYMSLWTVYITFKFLTKKEGMGHGDFKLLAMIGAFLGWKIVLLVIILGSLSGTIVGIASLLSGTLARGKPIPFGPHLALGGLIGLFWGNDLITMYLRLSGLN